jgi:hypothetical protein
MINEKLYENKKLLLQNSLSEGKVLKLHAAGFVLLVNTAS